MRTEDLVKELEQAKQAVTEPGLNRLALTTQYYNTQISFINRLEQSIERAKQLMNADLIVRKKHAMKQQKLVKKMTQSFRQIDKAYKQGQIKDTEGSVFARAYDKAVRGNLKKASEILSELEDTVNDYNKYSRLDEQAKTRKKELSQKTESIKALLEQAKHATPVDKNYAKKHEEVLRALKKMKQLRIEYLQKLSGKTVTDYVNMLKNKELVEAGFPSTNPANLINFMKDYQELLSVTPEELLEYQSWTDGKLKHAFPETNKFRNIMGEYASWLASLKRLESSDFMVVRTASDAKKLSFLFKGTEAGDLLSTLVELEPYWAEPPKSARVLDTGQLKADLLEKTAELALLKNI